MTVNVSNTNAYANPFSTAMANDYFGSQIFGSNPFAYQQQNQTRFTKAPNDLASYLVQQHVGALNVSSAPTMQDYVNATQIANMFSGQNAMISPYTSFTQNDMFAQQTIPYMLNNGQYYV